MTKYLPPAFFLSVFLFSCTSGEIKVDIAESESHYNLGLEFAKMSLYKNSLEEFELALKHDPNNQKARRKKGLVHFGLKQYDAAKTSFDNILSVEADNVQVHINLGMVYYAKGETDKARKQWEHAIRIHETDNDSKAFNNIANLYKIGIQTGKKPGAGISS